MSALVLAGGASHRMGSPKALLPFGGSTFLRHIVGTLQQAGIADVVVVLGAGAAEIRSTMWWFDGAIVENPDWESGQLSSIHAGLEILARRRIDGAFIWPVDHPAVSPELIVDLVRMFRSCGKGIILPVHAGRRGHPVIFSSKMFPILMTASPAEGARAVIRSHPEEVSEMEASDPGILQNIDTKEDLLRLTQLACSA